MSCDNLTEGIYLLLDRRLNERFYQWCVLVIVPDGMDDELAGQVRVLNESWLSERTVGL